VTTTATTLTDTGPTSAPEAMSRADRDRFDRDGYLVIRVRSPQPKSLTTPRHSTACTPANGVPVGSRRARPCTCWVPWRTARKPSG
jgi:hypothetical protein